MKTPNKGRQDARGEQGVNVVNKMGAKEMEKCDSRKPLERT